jgi:hypothetical protein
VKETLDKTGRDREGVQTQTMSVKPHAAQRFVFATTERDLFKADMRHCGVYPAKSRPLGPPNQSFRHLVASNPPVSCSECPKLTSTTKIQVVLLENLTNNSLHDVKGLVPGQCCNMLDARSKSTGAQLFASFDQSTEDQRSEVVIARSRTLVLYLEHLSNPSHELQ